jgi:hypothetical protein
VIDTAFEGTMPKHLVAAKVYPGMSNSYLETVVIPAGVTEIEAEAFKGCKQLVSVTIPTGVEDIGENAFAGCDKLIQVILPKGLKTVGNNAFAGCTSITRVWFLGEVPEHFDASVFPATADGIMGICLADNLKAWVKVVDRDAMWNGLKMYFGNTIEGAPVVLPVWAKGEFTGNLNVTYLNAGEEVQEVYTLLTQLWIKQDYTGERATVSGQVEGGYRIETKVRDITVNADTVTFKLNISWQDMITEEETTASTAVMTIKRNQDLSVSVRYEEAPIKMDLNTIYENVGVFTK